MFILPLTSRASVGVVMPIPILPSLRTYNRDVAPLSVTLRPAAADVVVEPVITVSPVIVAPVDAIEIEFVPPLSVSVSAPELSASVAPVASHTISLAAFNSILPVMPTLPTTSSGSSGVASPIPTLPVL